MGAVLRPVVDAIRSDPPLGWREPCPHGLQVFNGLLGGSNVLSHTEVRRTGLPNSSGDQKVIRQNARLSEDPPRSGHPNPRSKEGA
eukprot:7473195-Alexandrium_andersonii.AAC.1